MHQPRDFAMLWHQSIYQRRSGSELAVTYCMQNGLFLSGYSSYSIIIIWSLWNSNYGMHINFCLNQRTFAAIQNTLISGLDSQGAGLFEFPNSYDPNQQAVSVADLCPCKFGSKCHRFFCYLFCSPHLFLICGFSKLLTISPHFYMHLQSMWVRNKQ